MTPQLLSNRLQEARGQTWIGESELVSAGYPCVLGEIVRVPRGKLDNFYELAGRVPAYKVDLPGNKLVWWLLPIDSADIPSSMEGGE